MKIKIDKSFVSKIRSMVPENNIQCIATMDIVTNALFGIGIIWGCFI
jgi:hypothetical protein